MTIVKRLRWEAISGTGLLLGSCLPEREPGRARVGPRLDAGSLAEPGRGFGPAGCRESLTAGPPQASPSHQ